MYKFINHIIFSCLFALLTFQSGNIFAVSVPVTGCSIDSVIVSNPACHGECTGSISVFAQGDGTLSFQWPGIPGADSSFVSGLCAGLYAVIITDSSGCMVYDSILVDQPDSLSYSLQISNQTCPGGCSGSVTVTGLDSTSVYTFQWPGYMSTSPYLGNLCQGTYIVIVTDSLGCSVSGSAQVGYDPPFTLSLTSTPASCLNACNGTATVVATGIPPFNYSWSTGPIQNTATATGLCTGNYLVNVTDSTGCVVSDSVFVPLSPAPAITFNPVFPACNEGCDGRAEIIISGNGAYSVSWNTIPPQDSIWAVDLCEGTYIATVTDTITGCVFVDSVQIIDPPVQILSFTTMPSACDNICTGMATVHSSAPGPYTYLWQTGASTQTITQLCPGIYSVTVTDSLGCSATSTVSVQLQQLAFNVTDAYCNTICDGTLEVILPAGSQWQITWFTTPVQNTPTAVNLCAGSYTVNIVDTSGCVISGIAEVQQQQPIGSTFSVTPVSCSGFCDGQVIVSLTGNSPFTIDWTSLPGQNNDTITQLCSGFYPYLISDSLGCSIFDSVYISEPAIPQFTYTIDPNSCFNICDATANISAVFPGNYSYIWQTTPIQQGNSAIGLCAGFSSIEITDSSGCVYLDSILIMGPPEIDILFNTVTPSCPGECDGFISGWVSGGTPGYSYSWSNGFTTPEILNLCAGSYTFTVTDSEGCIKTDSILLPDPDSIHISYQVTDASCATCTDGAITINATGGSPGYFYYWTPGGAGGPALTNILPGIYNICVADNSLCIVCEDITVSFFNAMPGDQNTLQEVFIAPNPFSEKTSIELNGIDFKWEDETVFSVYDMTGRKIKGFSTEHKRVAADKISLTINANNVPDGMYWFNFTIGNSKSFSGKLVIQR